MKISEIARLAGVSPAAVSRYINGGSLSEEKRQIIKKVIDETGYVPNLTARSLRQQRSDSIGVIVPKFNSDSVSKLCKDRVTGVLERFLECFHTVVIATGFLEPAGDRMC